MISSHYFSVQKLTFSGVGINLSSSNSNEKRSLIKYPVLLYGILLSSFFHLLLVTHFAYIHITDFVEVTDSLPLFCQLLLCLLKVAIFLHKRQDILLLIQDIHEINFKSTHEEMLIVQRANAKDNFLCTLYLRLVVVTGSCGVLHPLIYGLYAYFTSGEVVLVESNKGSYFWNHHHLAGYSLVYIFNIISTYFSCIVSLAFDTLFSWFVSNIVAQFHIIGHRFDQFTVQHSQVASDKCKQNFLASIISCVRYHRQTLYLAEKLNAVYGEIIFIKFIIVCSEICSLVFQVGRPNDSLAELAYKCLFLSAVALQLVLYCWNGQRIKDESMKVSTAIYCAIDWSSLSKCYTQLFLLSMVRSQKCSRVTGIFFEVDLTLYIWVFKTAGSLLTAIKTLEENKD